VGRGGADGSKERVEENRQEVEGARANPDHYARLLQELNAFLSLTPEQQNRMRKLDQDLNSMDPAKADRLRRSLAQYAEWKERLPEADRKKIESAPDQQERLRRIKELREQQWIDRLPRVQRERIRNATGPERAELIKKYRKEEQERRKEWQAAVKHWEELITKGEPPARRSE